MKKKKNEAIKDRIITDIINSFEQKEEDYHKSYGSFIYSHDSIKNKKATVSPINKKDKCFQYVVAVAVKS